MRHCLLRTSHKRPRARDCLCSKALPQAAPQSFFQQTFGDSDMNLSDLKQFGLDIPFPYKSKYENYIGGKWVPPVNGEYFENVSPITGKPFCQVARSSADDVDLAVDAPHAVRRQWARTPAVERSNILLRIADRMEENLHMLSVAETIDNGKPLRETQAA